MSKVAHEINVWIADGGDWHDGCTWVAQKYGITFSEAVMAFRDEFDMHPRDVASPADDPPDEEER